MSYLKVKKWSIIPKTSLKILRNCPKCNCKSEYISTEKFRVNANGNYIDIWLIYQCEKCKSTYNLSICERVNIKTLNSAQYEKFLSNNRALAIKCSFDKQLINKNKAEPVYDSVEYDIIQSELEESYDNQNTEIEIAVLYGGKYKLQSILSNILNMSGSKIKKLIEAGEIYSKDKVSLKNKFVTDKIRIIISNKVICGSDNNETN